MLKCLLPGLIAFAATSNVKTLTLSWFPVLNILSCKEFGIVELWMFLLCD